MTQMLMITAKKICFNLWIISEQMKKEVFVDIIILPHFPLTLLTCADYLEFTGNKPYRMQARV